MKRLFFSIVVWNLAAASSLQCQRRDDANRPTAGVELDIAASDDLNSPLRELARQFEQKTGIHIRPTLADSASLLRQIRGGSYFDAVFLPDINALRRLAVVGKVTSPSITEYARDHLVLCFAPGVRIQPRPGNPLLLLTDKRISRIAIVSPQHSVFGKITVQALTGVHIYDPEFKRKLVAGEDVAEVAHMFEKGDADVALLPGSAIRAHRLESTLVIPIASSHLYTPVREGAGVLKGSKHPRQALEFVKFAVSPDGRAIFRQAGFDEPPWR